MLKIKNHKKLFKNKTSLNVQKIQGVRIINSGDGGYPDFRIGILLCNTKKPQQSHFYRLMAANYYGLT